jgi:hypothetical protein
LLACGDSGGTGTDFARFLFVHVDSPASIPLAKLFPTDQIMLDPGYPGTLEYSLVKAGIPAVTTELGGARKFVPEMVKMGVDGNMNVLVHYGIIAAPMRPTSADTNVFIGNDLESLRGAAGGFLTLLVNRADCDSKSCDSGDDPPTEQTDNARADAGSLLITRATNWGLEQAIAEHTSLCSRAEVCDVYAAFMCRAHSCSQCPPCGQ